MLPVFSGFLNRFLDFILGLAAGLRGLQESSRQNGSQFNGLPLNGTEQRAVGTPDGTVQLRSDRTLMILGGQRGIMGEGERGDGVAMETAL